MSSLNKKLFRNLLQLKSQVLSIAILIICGISVFVSSWSSYLSLQDAQQDFYEHYRFADLFATVTRAPQDLLPKIIALPGVEVAEPRIVATGIIDLSNQPEPAVAQLVSMQNSEAALNKVYLRQGHLPSENTWEIVVHESFAQAHQLNPGDSLSIAIKGQKYLFKISGIGISPEFIYVLSPSSPLPDDKHFGVFWINQNTLKSLVKMDGSFNNLSLRVSKNASISQIKTSIDHLLKPFGCLGTIDRTLQASHMFIADEIRQQKTMAFVIPMIFLAVAAFILNVILSRIVYLQRSQIGMLKAIGYDDQKIFLHYFKMVTVMMLIGIVPALFAGHWIGQWYAQLYQEYYRFPTLDFSLSAQPTIFGVLFGLIPGWIGSWQSLSKIMRLTPMEALRPPAPPVFKKSFFDRLKLSTNMDSQSKIVIRNFTNKPLRLLLNTMGITAAVAILITGNFWYDIIDYMLDQQFFLMNREDINVSFSSPLRLNGLQELRSIEGVYYVEGNRNVAIKVNLGPIKKNTVMIGIDSEHKLRQVVDQQGKSILPLTGGVLLSRYFEREHRLRAGETLELELVEGSQRSFNVPIAGFVDDMMGIAVYANKSDLHHWVREDISFDSANLLADHEQINKIYYQLKQRPEIVGVAVKRSVMKSFVDNMAAMILTFTGILILFAMAIAGAILYNSMRISFSERSWELASLQILGFTGTESFLLLFYELALQLVVAMLPGLTLGYLLSKWSLMMIHNENFTFPMYIDPTTYALAGTVMVLTLFLSSISIYFKVNELNFSEALKARE